MLLLQTAGSHTTEPGWCPVWTAEHEPVGATARYRHHLVRPEPTGRAGLRARASAVRHAGTCSCQRSTSHRYALVPAQYVTQVRARVSAVRHTGMFSLEVQYFTHL